MIYEFCIAGVQHHQSKLIAHMLKPGDQLYLEREPENTYDSNAIKINYQNEEKKYNNICMGYVPSKYSAQISSEMLTKKCTCVLKDYTPTEKPWKKFLVIITMEENK